ncbi:MAG TPA: glycoside hydrolase family 43 protein [Mycobacteriales bacterium]|nr:glycoside hydrolase family 43 protein [Mycobacteriales bacterium]
MWTASARGARSFRPLPPRLLIVAAAATTVWALVALLGGVSGVGAPGLPRLGAARVVEQDDVGDPYILPAPGGVHADPTARYVLFWTTDWQSNVPTAVSPDLIHWHRIADALPVLPTWAVPTQTMTWAPSAVQVAGGWVLYFSTEEAGSRVECIGAAFSPDPAGPYRDTAAAPLICQRAQGGSIDPSVVRDAHGGRSLVWKSDGNASGASVGIWQQALAADGRSLLGPAHRLIGADQPWEHGIVEGPAMLADTRGGWWLFYSGGAWQSNTYDTGVAWCATVAGPCRPTSAAPLLSSNPTAVSPGGLDTFVDNRGVLWASYSAFPSAPANVRAAMAENRVLEIAPVLSH